MKVLITGYNTCCFNKSGGVQVRVKKIHDLLSHRENIEVEYFRPMETDFDNVDILHLFKLEPEFLGLIVKAKNQGVKVVLSSIVSMTYGRRIDAYRLLFNKIPIPNIYKMKQRIMDLVDCVITETKMEADFIMKHYGVSKKKIRIIPNGIEMEYYEGNEIYEEIGEKKDFVLQVGRIDSNKNQLNAIKSLKDTDIDFVIIGGPEKTNSSYMKACKEEASNRGNIHFLGWLDKSSPILKSAYAHAKVLLFPSYHETFGLVALEGAVNGCNIAMTKTLPIHDFHVFDDCWLFNPNDVNDIRQKVLAAYVAPRTDDTKKKVLETFSWNKIIDEHIEIYKALSNGIAK